MNALHVIAFVAILAGCNNKHIPVAIIKQQKSIDGISVTYTENKDTFALDYLSRKEYDSLCVQLSNNNKHACRWKLCPYKGITQAQADIAVSEYVGEACTDAYHIDMLHIQYPTLDADQLDSLLNIKH
jgi:hypothetical protein